MKKLLKKWWAIPLEGWPRIRILGANVNYAKPFTIGLSRHQFIIDADVPGCGLGWTLIDQTLLEVGVTWN